MPVIPGWFLASTSRDGGAFPQLAICLLSVYCLLTLWRLTDGTFAEDVVSTLEKNFTLEEYKIRQALLSRFFVVPFGAFTVVANVLVSYAGLISGDRSVSPWVVAVDLLITLVSSYFLYMPPILAATCVVLVCSVHHFDVARFVISLANKEFSVDDAIYVHGCIRDRVRDSARYLSSFFAAVILVPLGAFVLVAANLLLIVDQPGCLSFLRFSFLLFYIVPALFVWVGGCSVAQSMGLLHQALSETEEESFAPSSLLQTLNLQAQTNAAAAAAAASSLSKMYSYIVVWRESGPFGFVVFGVEISYTVLVQMLYAVATLFIAMLQVYYSRNGNSFACH